MSSTATTRASKGWPPIISMLSNWSREAMTSPCTIRRVSHTPKSPKTTRTEVSWVLITSRNSCQVTTLSRVSSSRWVTRKRPRATSRKPTIRLSQISSWWARFWRIRLINSRRSRREPMLTIASSPVRWGKDLLPVAVWLSTLPEIRYEWTAAPTWRIEITICSELQARTRPWSAITNRLRSRLSSRRTRRCAPSLTATAAAIAEPNRHLLPPTSLETTPCSIQATPPLKWQWAKTPTNQAAPCAAEAPKSRTIVGVGSSCAIWIFSTRRALVSTWTASWRKRVVSN